MPLKIAFVLPSSSKEPLPSTRIAVLNMLPFLRAANFDPQIVFEPPFQCTTPDVSGLAPRLISEGFQVVCFQKIGGPSVLALVRELRAAGIKSVHFVCDTVDV